MADLSGQFVKKGRTQSFSAAEVTMELPERFSKAHRNVSICRLKFYDERDVCSSFGDADGRSEPLITGGAQLDMRSALSQRLIRAVG